MPSTANHLAGNSVRKGLLEKIGQHPENEIGAERENIELFAY